MKIFAKTILCASLAAMTFSSCELDQYPEGSILEKESWESIEDVDKYYIGLLSAFRGVSGGANVYVTEVQSDLFNVTRNASSLNQEHKWEFTTSQFAGDNIWANNYALIRYANHLLDNIDRVGQNEENKDDEDVQAYLNEYKGTCHLARAYAYANMLPRYCVNYENEAQAEQAFGLPKVETVDLDYKPHRGTLKATFDNVFKELDLAEELLTSEGGIDEPGLDVVTAVRARVCLMHKDYDEAIKLCQKLMKNYDLVDDANSFKAIWTSDKGSEIIFQPSFSIYERGGSYNPVFISYSDAQSAWTPYFLPTQGLIDMYTDRDFRKDAYFTQVKVKAQTDEQNRVWMFNKYPGNPAYLYSNEYSQITGVPLGSFNQVKAIRLAEFYLIAAEAALFKANPDEDLAKKYLLELRECRGLTRNSDKKVVNEASGDDLVKVMKDEWIREMVGEGFRLDCLKRWHDGFTRMTPQEFNNNILNRELHTVELTVDADNPRFLWEIPRQDQQANENLKGENNWNFTY